MVREHFAGRVIWNINSTARGGGVAEMLRYLVAYARGAGVDARWAVIAGEPEFFHITKRLHNALHGERGDGSPLGDEQRKIYERVLHQNATELLAEVSPADVVILHDPQTAGLIPYLAELGAIVIWRCHIGADTTNEEVERGWAFLAPYLARADRYVFSRAAYIPEYCDHGRSVVIPPCIDPFSPKNQEMDEKTIHSILVHTGLVEGPNGQERTFIRDDGSPGRVEHRADVVRLGRAPLWTAPLVVQVSRWDRLKDPIGVMEGFARLVAGGDSSGAHLVLAGPNVKAVADDPEGAEVFGEVEAAWRGLPHAVRDRIHLASLPMHDIEENAAIVNALQRHATVVVQKSIREGFGLTVTEAMWKGKPVVASAVGGIQDQIVDGESGLLLRNPRDLDAFAGLVRTLLADPARARRLGEAARERVRECYLGLTSLITYGQLIVGIDSARRAAATRVGAGEVGEPSP
ncbi:MAG: glycosyltransferase [Candidatus Dadabacteria bacterium]|nr:MAG: glycosyltransferase [Candidatus Dadabacteria bacterium]